jgi:hypothetical protein
VSQSRSKPPARPGSGHRDGCSCGSCRGWRDGELEAARLRAFNKAKVQLALAGAVEGRKEAKRAAAHDGIERDVAHTDRKVRELREAFEQKDPRTEVFLALRAAGKTLAEAEAEVERQFANETTNEGETHGTTDDTDPT